MKKFTFAYFYLVFLSLSGQSFAQWQNYEIDSEQTVVTLRMSHSVLGRFDTNARDALKGRVQVNPSQGTLRVEKLVFLPEKLTSLIGLRDDHLKDDYLEVKKHPQIFFDGTTLPLFLKGKSNASVESFKGILTLKGQPVEVTGLAKVIFDEDMLKGEATMKTRISLFPIKTPRYMGVGVKDEIEILLEFKARPDLSAVDIPSESDFKK
jgi:polyisoprenoid-binding protein YceI